jgi:type II secretory pathway pseudopilin PulG
MRSRRGAVLIATLVAAVATAPVFADDLAPLMIGTKFLKGASLRLYGFVEADSIYDTTQSFTEEPDSNLVQKPSSILGQRSREQMSVRDSRLGLELDIPTTDSGWKTNGVIEVDFLGDNAENANPGTTPNPQTERDYYNNPSLRVRHAYVDLSKGEFDSKIGQYWSLFGWQPFYFPGEASVLASQGMLYRRFIQARVMDTRAISDGWTLETAADAAKPPEANSGSPEWQGGVRIASTKLTGASINGAATTMVGLSAALTGVLIPIRTANIGSPTGQGAAFDFLVPIIPSSDGKSRDNTLIWAGEAAAGTGIGGLEYAGLALGVPGVTAATPGADGAIDSGMGGLDSSGNFELLRVRVFRSHLQYSLGKWAASIGYAQVEGRNLDRFSFGTNTNGLAPKIQYGYVSAMYDPLAWLRFAGEVSQMRDTYDDPANRYATNNRYQLSAYFIF